VIAICTGVLAATSVILGAPAPVLPGRWAGIRSGSHLGSKAINETDSRECQVRDRGFDGDRLREIDVVALPLVPSLYQGRLLHLRRRSGIGRFATVAKGSRFPRSQRHDVAARAEREGLRRVVRGMGVPRETVRVIVT
jgi:hypothetical protein